LNDGKRVDVDFQRAKPAGSVIADALRCYRAFPLLFAAITLIVVIPYAVLVYAFDGSGLLGQGHATSSEVILVGLLDVLLVGPLISALHVHALTEIAQNRVPRIADVLARGVRVLAVVTAAQVVAGICTAVGFVFFIVPGLFLLARWAVVAQVAAMERTDWYGALRRSAQLTSGNYLHALGVLVTVGLINAVLDQGLGAAVTSSGTAVQVILGVVVELVTLSFSALTGAMLYFDLTARQSRL
jgi:hypothetical protein